MMVDGVAIKPIGYDSDWRTMWSGTTADRNPPAVRGWVTEPPWYVIRMPGVVWEGGAREGPPYPDYPGRI